MAIWRQHDPSQSLTLPWGPAHAALQPHHAVEHHPRVLLGIVPPDLVHRDVGALLLSAQAVEIGVLLH